MYTETIIIIFTTGLVWGFCAGLLWRKRTDYATLYQAHMQGADNALRILTELMNAKLQQHFDGLKENVTTSGAGTDIPRP